MGAASGDDDLYWEWPRRHVSIVLELGTFRAFGGYLGIAERVPHWRQRHFSFDVRSLMRAICLD